MPDSPTITRPLENEIYRQLWNMPEYRAYAPGADAARDFLRVAKPKQGAHVLDLGCGTGRGGYMLGVLGGLNVTIVDFADNCLDPEVRNSLDRPMAGPGSNQLHFHKADLSGPLPQAQYGFCVDVMEHIPPDQVMPVLSNLLQSVQYLYLQIATVPDIMGELIGHALHLSVHPAEWWKERLEEHECKVFWSHETGGHCSFYVSNWLDAQAVVDLGELNCEMERVKANVAHNIAQGWLQAQPYELQDCELMILGGGPSLAEFEDEIRTERAAGGKLVTLNGAYNWCLDRGITPSATIVVDAREFNARFLKPVVDECRYLVASQCDPAALEGLPKDRTFLWHTTAEEVAPILDEHYELWYGVPGGSTVLLRALPLLRMLGFQKFVLYGCDSCLVGDQHHAYHQPENDDQAVLRVMVGDRTFHCHPWQIAQAQEFVGLIKMLGNEMEICVKGDGLLAHIIQHAADQDIARETAESGNVVLTPKTGEFDAITGG